MLNAPQELPLEQLSDIKAKSIVEWIARENVRRAIVKHFRQFLMTYVDDNGASVYGQRIRSLGESECSPSSQKVPPSMSCRSQL
jgi:DNA replication licensing factor MCM2